MALIRRYFRKTCRPQPYLDILVVLGIIMRVCRVESLAAGSGSAATGSNGKNNRLSAILFDIDGTLVDSDPLHFAVFQELFLEEEGFHNNEPIDEAFFRKNIAGRANALIMEDLFPSWPIEKRSEWSVRKEARFREVAAATMEERKMPGLDRLRAWVDANGLGKAAVTNAPRANAEAMLDGIGYREWFGETRLIIGDECARPKPDPCPYLTACERIGSEAEDFANTVDPTECIVFEDSPSGARAGVAAGAFVVGILSGQEESTLREAGCELVIRNYEDPKLWEHLDSLSPSPLPQHCVPPEPVS